MDSRLIERLKDAIEGECEGLAIDDQHARAILEYVLAEPAAAERAPLNEEQIADIFQKTTAEVQQLELEHRYTFAAWLPIAVRLTEEAYDIRRAVPGAQVDASGARGAGLASGDAKDAEVVEGTAAPTPQVVPAQEAVAWTHERHIAVREAYQASSLSGYVEARPVQDGAVSRRCFEDGYKRGFDQGVELRAAAAPARAQPTSAGATDSKGKTK